MTTAPTDRFRFLARSAERQKTPIRAEVPEPKAADGVATLRLYDPIDSWGEWWGVSAKEFAAALDGLDDDVTTIELHINSPGGEVFEGIAIMNLLRQHRARVVATVDGLAASAASFIACGADELVMARGSELMLHDAWGICVGNASDMQQMADELGRFSDNLAEIYAAKAGGTAQEWRAVMEVETWYSAQEAVDAGLADRLDSAPASSAAKNRFDLTVFNYAGRDKAPAPRSPVAVRASGRSAQEGAGMDPAKIREALGLKADVSDEDVLATASEYQQAAARAQTGPPASPVPDGHVVVPEAKLRDLEEGARAGIAAAERLRVQDREQFLDSVRDRYAAANREAWAKEYDRDPEGTRKHFASAPVLVPTAEIGHAHQAQNSADDDLYAEMQALRGLAPQEV